MIIRLFGITTPTGSFLLNIPENRFDKIYCYSRKKKFKYLDMNNVNFQKFINSIEEEEEEIWINLAPIWVFAEFLNNLSNELKIKPNKIKGIITCSSTSIFTKKYS